MMLALPPAAFGDTNQTRSLWDTHDTHGGTASTVQSTSASSASRPAYEIVGEETQSHRMSKHHGKATSAVSESALKQELEDAYGFNLLVDRFSDQEFKTFYNRYGYKPIPNNRNGYVLYIMSTIRELFPAIPSEIVLYMDEAVDLSIIVSIDKGTGADGIYYPDSNTIFLMYEGKAVVHEYGHMLHYALKAITGEEAFRRQWTALNQGLGYNSGRGGKGVYDFKSGRGAQGAVFYGDYATTDIYEDVAETFWMMIERPSDLEKLIAAGAPLAKKAALLDNLLREQLLKANTAVVTTAFEGYASSMGGEDLDGDGYCDDCGEWMGDGEEPGDTGQGVDWDYEDSWYDESWWSQDDTSTYDRDGDGYCDDCGEWLGGGTAPSGVGYSEYDLDGDGYCDDCGEWLGGGIAPGGYGTGGYSNNYWCDECGEYHSDGHDTGGYSDSYWCDECGEYHRY